MQDIESYILFNYSFLTFILLVVAFFVGYFFGKSRVAAAKKIDSEEIKKIATKNFNKWLCSLKTKDPKAVSKLYHDELTFHPTQLGKLQKGQSGAEEYFMHFLEKNPTGKLVEEEIQPLTPWLYLHSGLYDFTIDSAGEKKEVEARFSFLWILEKNGRWQILHHHSSPKPT